MHSLNDAFGKPKGAVSALESRFRRFDLDDSRFVPEEGPHCFLAKVPFLRDLMNCVVILKCAHN
jgi:hypothetical protein